MDFTHTNISPKKRYLKFSQVALKKVPFPAPEPPSIKSIQGFSSREDVREGKQWWISISESLKRFAYDSHWFAMYVLASANAKTWSFDPQSCWVFAFKCPLPRKSAFFSVTKLSMVTRFHRPGVFLHRVFSHHISNPKIKGSPGTTLMISLWSVSEYLAVPNIAAPWTTMSHA